MPNPSFWPALAAVGLFLIAAGFIWSFAITAAGIVVLIGSVYNWAFEPAG
jgi:hypothetical protein